MIELNTAIHLNYQGKRLFTKLADATFDYSKENGYKFVIGVANANNTHVFLRKFGIYLVAPLEVKVDFGDVFLI